MCGSGLFDLLEHAHRIEEARGLGAHVLRAWLVAGEARSVEDRDVNARAGQIKRRSGACRAAANNDHLRHVPIHPETPRIRDVTSIGIYRAMRAYAWDAKYSVSPVTR